MRPWRGRQAGRLTYEAFGVKIGLDVPDPELRNAVGDMLPAAWRSPVTPQPGGSFGLLRGGLGYRITSDDGPGSEHATIEVALGTLEGYVQQFISVHARDRIFVHAGAVAYDGSAILIPGESFSGKSTLVAALVAAGATYYSDEFAVLDPDGRLHPYPRRLSLRTQDGEPAQALHARDVGGIQAEQSTEVRMVVITRYKPGASWQPTLLSAAQGVVALLGMTLGGHERPVESMRALRGTLEGAIVLEGERGEAGSTATALLETLTH